jgi:tRNA(Arg) A34 adenosine deaminase TadA
MRQAITEAQQVPARPFGAVIVDAGTAAVVARGHNHTDDSPTFHGEIDAINHLASSRYNRDGRLLALYTTAEPCPMCQAAIAWADLGLVVYGTSIPFLRDLGWWQIDVRAEELARRTPFRNITVVGGVLEEECNALFPAMRR